MKRIKQEQVKAHGVQLGRFEQFQEIDSKELKSLNGGFPPVVFFLISTGIYFYDRRNEIAAGFMEGLKGR